MSTITGEHIWRNEKHRIRTIAGTLLKLENEIIEEFTSFKSVFEFRIRLDRDDGSVEHQIGWRVQHVNPYNKGDKPYKGGFMRDKKLSIGSLRAKAAWMTWKCALIGPTETKRIPFGGAKGGIQCDPKRYSQAERRRQMIMCARELDSLVGPTKDSLGPDAAVDAEDIRAFVTMSAELNADHGAPWGAVATGKPMEDAGGGCPGRLRATGRGMHYVYQEMRAQHSFFKKFPKKPKALLHGFGNVGSSYGFLAKEFGVIIIGVSDLESGVYHPNGIDSNALYAHKIRTGSLRDYQNAENIHAQRFLSLPCDILVVASTEAVLTNENADKVQAAVILEGANGPTLPEAEQKLLKRGVLIIPDILANAGGVTVSYFEWCQDMQGIFWEESVVNERLKQFMIGGTSRTLHLADQFGVDLRTAAHIGAMGYCAPALRKKHGWKKSDQSLY